MAIDNKYGKIDIPGIPDDEPVFVIVAQDKLAPEAIKGYSSIAYSYGAPKEFVSRVVSVADQFSAWQQDNLELVDLPD